ncbi:MULTISPECIES: galactan export ABC transporter permease subunit Wzm/RfbD [unclassified Rhodococcus (in: high G+C Gram-positive bacteria)]|uniref:galactan export ABC transporter permease subunit Wzm/RfbD n=1 Tax=unclassified Rhodococcus (in: high G+C Gram-positive bacteria) TaxID=192944 RepID=UPI00048218AD|nr:MULTISPECIES: ABC transporter permease [unclassified Rhodococcus (in: high G+C Gram-positive bacteria)]KQU27971.1 sugar ABC transporter permease [Rhodococcus sp. Leaf225]KQU46082.1 sugar ABC transporter permease [Rhodococcus sp. Leaf258]MBY6678324.1 ABC transporter permease [Rhodococcus sp. BP-332]MBY6683449.1 ABC transporter permease [Rhodococcus sp. BP-316]MBY6708878.1 ABC transporter permease [Rhodococcus sp. BP-241]
MAAPAIDSNTGDSNSGDAPASDSQTFRRAVRDLRQGYAQRELWLSLGWQDIKQRYRRSVIGPFWITIATGVQAVAMGLLYSVLLDIDLKSFLPHVTVGLIIWNLISASILEGADVFVANEGLIKQLPSALSVHIYRLVWRQVLLLGHNMLIYLIMLAVFRPELHWTIVMAIPAFGLIVVNMVWVSLLFGIIATRYRDLAPILGSVVTLLFFMTPIVWTTANLQKMGGAAADRARLVEINPLFHYLDILRAPLIGEDQQAYHWYIVLAFTVVGLAVTMVAMRTFRARVPYWV